ncbi:uncharacterized protein J7T54_003923 [Emericellopsis cladophorae]|uniref:Fungal STAND N-terminal Goodbye domain-containing protein n=1 Tax=Emericellopsis cladophorae TaxID=2686198 RepID=A0A9P9Y1Y2_9HYPO|nr:uncharacterized protein J7T54_003923 [Emericellopsis cladophorae]KAI6781658.1 hypothetical protein J7T54_003923 [Emericellopsis cladophorae]
MGSKTEKEEPPGYEASEFQAVLTDARALYRETSGDNLDDFMSPPMRTLSDLKTQLDISNEHFSSFRAKRASLFGVLTTMLKPVEIVGEVVSGAAGEIFPPTQSIFSAVMFLVNAANNVSSTYDSIVQLFGQLKDFTARFNVYLQHKMSTALREKVVHIFSALFQVLVLATKEVRRGRVKSYFRNLFGADSPVQEALADLQSLTLGEERQVLADTYGGVSRIDTKTDRVEHMVSQMSENIQEMRTEYKERATVAHQDRLREILEPSPFPEDFNTAFERNRVPGTGNWLLEDSGLKAWMRSETHYLWMSGGPGTGKSFLASRLISWGTDKLSHLAYFYFRANNPETRSVLQALRDVAYQLSESDALYGKHIARTVHSSDDIKTIPSAFRRLFVQPLEEDTRGRLFHVFLDGIDEAEPDELEELLRQLEPQEDTLKPPAQHSRVQIALVGRSYLTELVTSYLDPPSVQHKLTIVHVTPDRNANDVLTYIEAEVFTSRLLNRSTLDFKNQVIRAMAKRVDGLFILAKFMLADMNRKRRPTTILKSLESFPREINGVLSTTLANLSATITEEEATDLNEMLRWVTCAEQTLTLEQLEAILILEFEDPPFRFEDTLRGQYACFFELEREDGLTTDDLVKSHERAQKGQQESPTGRFRRSSSTGKKESPQRAVSPARRIAYNRRRTSPVALIETSPSRRYSLSRSPARRPELLDAGQEMEFRSKKSTTMVTFFHASVRDFFRDEDTLSATRGVKGPDIGFDISKARLHVLETCLRIFNDKKWFDKHKLGVKRYALRQYAAWYWQEHLAALSPSAVSVEEKRKLGPQIYRMLTQDDIIYDWSVLYEQNDEGLEVLTDSNISALKAWMSDPDVLSGLGPEAQQWAKGSVQKPTGLFQQIGRFYARAWLDPSFKQYVPTRFCFKIVQSIAYMEEGHKWSDSQCHWSAIPVVTRIDKATEWAACEKTAHWYRRVGSTFLTSGMNEEALQHYNSALKLEPDSVETLGRKAFCLSVDERYGEALHLALKCEAKEKEILENGKPTLPQRGASQWRLYKDHFLIAQCYYRAREVDLAIRYFHEALDSAENAALDYHERFEAVTSFLDVLAAENKHEEMIKVMEDMALQPSSRTREQSRLVDFLCAKHSKPIVLEWLPKAACTTGKTDFLVERLEMSVDVAHDRRDTLKELYLRLAMGTALVYSRDFDEAIEVFEQISLVEYRPRGNVPTRSAHALSFQKLASLYKGMALRAGITSSGADRWIQKLEYVQAKQSAHRNQDLPASMLGSDVNAAAIYLALFYRLRGRKRDAEKLLSALILESCEILEDEDLQNDQFALENLLKLFVAAGDDGNALALAVSMRRLNPEASLSTPGDSPVHTRLEPKLPDIQSSSRSCANCLEIVPSNAEFFICHFCLDAFCGRCLHKKIQPGTDKTSLCQPDHEWMEVPPLQRVLHTGQVLKDAEVMSYQDWKHTIRERWEKGGL